MGGYREKRKERWCCFAYWEERRNGDGIALPIGKKEEKWIWERESIGKWRLRENGKQKEDERIRDEHVVVKEMTGREAVLSSLQLTLQMRIT